MTSHSPVQGEMNGNPITGVTQTRNIISNRRKLFRNRNRKGSRFCLHHVVFVCDVYREKHCYPIALLDGRKLMVRVSSCDRFFFSWSLAWVCHCAKQFLRYVLHYFILLHLTSYSGIMLLVIKIARFCNG